MDPPLLPAQPVSPGLGSPGGYICPLCPRSDLPEGPLPGQVLFLTQKEGWSGEGERVEGRAGTSGLLPAPSPGAPLSRCQALPGVGPREHQKTQMQGVHLSCCAYQAGHLTSLSLGSPSVQWAGIHK